VLINIFGMALPFIFAPQWYLDLFGLPGGGGSVIWMRQAGLLLFLISILYVSGGRDPIRYSLNAKFAVLVRMTIGSYWLWLVFVEGQTRSFLIFGIVDWVYAIFNGILLWLVIKNTETVDQLVVSQKI
jgi:type IV secretory pathway TrbD component